MEDGDKIPPVLAAKPTTFFPLTCTHGASLPFLPCTQNNSTMGTGFDVVQGAGKDRVLCKSLQGCPKGQVHLFWLLKTL